MAFDEHLGERVRSALRAEGATFEEKRMMGGLCLMVDGKMCLGVVKERLMVRVAPEEYEAALRRPGCEPMDFTGRPMRGFVFVNPDGLATESALASWVRLALDFNPRAVSSKRPRNVAARRAGRRS